ncbi:Uncharacterised protein g9253 [Pycnogonum litorale]
MEEAIGHKCATVSLSQNVQLHAVRASSTAVSTDQPSTIIATPASVTSSFVPTARVLLQSIENYSDVNVAEIEPDYPNDATVGETSTTHQVAEDIIEVSDESITNRAKNCRTRKRKRDDDWLKEYLCEKSSFEKERLRLAEEKLADDRAHRERIEFSQQEILKQLDTKTEALKNIGQALTALLNKF